MAEANDVTEVTDKLDTLNVDGENIITPETSTSGNNGNLEANEQSGSDTTADSGPAVKLKTSLAQKSRNLSAKDKAKIAEMVKGLAKFKHAEEDIHTDSMTSKPKPSKEKKAKVKEVNKETDILVDQEYTCKPGDREKVVTELGANREVTVTEEISVGKTQKVKKNKGKKEKKKDMDKELDNEDEWEDVESEGEISRPSLTGEVLTGEFLCTVQDMRMNGKM